MSNTLIITSGGTGSRMGLGYNKMLHQIDGQSVLNHTINKFLKYEEFTQIIIAVSEKDYEQIKQELPSDKRIELVLGGSERQYSVYNALTKASGDYVFVHDGARMHISDELIKRCLDAIKSDEDAYVCAVQSKDSIRKVKNGIITEVLERSELYSMQTPQIATREVLLAAHNMANENQILETDEVGLLFRYGFNVRIIEGDYANIKLTTIEDLGGK